MQDPTGRALAGPKEKETKENFGLCWQRWWKITILVQSALKTRQTPPYSIRAHGCDFSHRAWIHPCSSSVHLCMNSSFAHFWELVFGTRVDKGQIWFLASNYRENLLFWRRGEYDCYADRGFSALRDVVQSMLQQLWRVTGTHRFGTLLSSGSVHGLKLGKRVQKRRPYALGVAFTMPVIPGTARTALWQQAVPVLGSTCLS